jgi:hypothetical protein
MSLRTARRPCRQDGIVRILLDKRLDGVGRLFDGWTHAPQQQDVRLSRFRRQVICQD